MSSVSLSRFGSTLQYCQSLAHVPIKKYVGASFPILMWTLAGLFAVARTQFNSNLTGSTYQFPVYDILFMLCILLLLNFGLDSKSCMLTLPWLFYNFFSICFNHFYAIMYNVTQLKTTRHASYLPWGAVGVSSLLLVIRITLSARIVQMYIYWWFRQKIDSLKTL